ncbi:MAG: NYN domain-containing protein [Patescibacteria group bacterium]
MDRVSILIDGGNFHHRVLNFVGASEASFDFEKFANFLANGRKIVPLGKRFYVGTVRQQEGNERVEKAMSRQTALFTRLRKTQWETKTSKLRFRKEKIQINEYVENYNHILNLGIKEIIRNTQREKGIDVKIATDIIVGAIDNQFDTIIIVSSDTDLVPAIDWIRNRYRKKVEYIGFSLEDINRINEPTKPSPSMIHKTDIQRVLIASDLEQFIDRSIQETLV